MARRRRLTPEPVWVQFARTMARAGELVTSIVNALRSAFAGITREMARVISREERARIDRVSTLLDQNFGRFLRLEDLAGCGPGTRGLRVSVTIPTVSSRTGSQHNFVASFTVQGARRVGDLLTAAVEEVARVARGLGYEYRGPERVRRGDLPLFTFNSIDCI